MTDMRVFIAEPDRDVRIGLEMYLDRKAGMRVVGIAVRSEGLVSQVGAAQPDIVILDWGLIAPAPDIYISNLKSIESQPHIIVVHVRPETRGAAKAAGANYFHSKDSPPDQLLECLQLIKHERTQATNLKEET